MMTTTAQDLARIVAAKSDDDLISICRSDNLRFARRAARHELTLRAAARRIVNGTDNRH